MKTTSPINLFVVSTPAPEPIARFFQAALGWNLDRSGDTVFVAGAGDGIGGAIAKPSASTGRTGVTLYAEVDDLQAALRRVEAAGGHADGPIVDLAGGGGALAHFQAPDGSLWGLWCRPATEPTTKTRKPRATPKVAKAKSRKPKATAPRADTKPTSRKRSTVTPKTTTRKTARSGR